MAFSRQEYWSGCHALLQGIFPAQGSNLHFLHLLPWQVDSLPLNHLGSLMCKRGREKDRQAGWIGAGKAFSGKRVNIRNTQYYSQPASAGKLLPQTTVFFLFCGPIPLSVSITHPFDDPGPNYELTFSLQFLSHAPNGTEIAKGLGVICVISGVKGSPF